MDPAIPASSATSIIDNSFLDPDAPCAGLAIIVLNCRLPSVTPFLLKRAALTICADGGANRLYDELPAMLREKQAEIARSRYLPNLIRGDLDSIRPDVLGYYKSQGVPITDVSEDQDTTDLQKCIHYIEKHHATLFVDQHVPAIQTIVAVGSHGGRLDHMLSHLSDLYAFRHLNLVLCGDGNVTRLVLAGRSLVRPHRRIEGPSCGLVPLAGPATATTRGLRWNLDHTTMRIGGLLSTSNLLTNDEVWVESDADLIWTTELVETKSVETIEPSAANGGS
jgi:thiamine pyrophosphokinase